LGGFGQNFRAFGETSWIFGAQRRDGRPSGTVANDATRSFAHSAALAPVIHSIRSCADSGRSPSARGQSCAALTRAATGGLSRDAPRIRMGLDRGRRWSVFTGLSPRSQWIIRGRAQHAIISPRGRWNSPAATAEQVDSRERLATLAIALKLVGNGDPLGRRLLMDRADTMGIGWLLHFRGAHAFVDRIRSGAALTPAQSQR